MTETDCNRTFLQRLKEEARQRQAVEADINSCIASLSVLEAQVGFLFPPL